MRGGRTPTLASERHYEQSFQEAEERRDALEHDKKVAQVPVERGGGKLHTSRLTDKPEIPEAHIHLIYVNRHGHPTGEVGVADLLIGVDDRYPKELTLILTCPRCAGGQKHLQDCQMRIRQTNKWFELDAAKGPETFPFLEDPDKNLWKIYLSAGVIRESEPCRCPDCGWRFRLAAGKNPDTNELVTLVWPD
jgi:hypothetical protein